MFEYIATDAPQQCASLCAKYGYQAQAQTTADMADCMGQLVHAVGEPALRDLVALHPDKDLILEQFGGGTAGGSWTGGSTGGCGCQSCKSAGMGAATQQYLQGGVKASDFIHTHQAGLFIIGGLLVVTLAIISTKS